MPKITKDEKTISEEKEVGVEERVTSRFSSKPTEKSFDLTGGKPRIYAAYDDAWGDDEWTNPILPKVKEDDKWWNSWKKKSYFEEKKKGESFTSRWASRFDNYESRWSYAGEKKNSVNYEAIRQAVTRTANVVENTTSEEDKTITVKWSDGTHHNRSDSPEVFLSPNIVTPELCLRTDWGKDELNDVLVGEALTEATLKRTMSPFVEACMTQTVEGSAKLNQRLWYCLERLAAEQQVMEDYPGFSGYFGAHRKYYTSDVAKVELTTAMGEMTAEVALAVVQWNFLHPAEPLDVTDAVLAEVVKFATEQASSCTDSQSRADATQAIIEEILKHWSLPPEEPDSGGGGGLKGDSRQLGMPQATRGETIQGKAEKGKEDGDEDDEDNEGQGAGRNPGGGASIADFNDWSGGTHETHVTTDVGTHQRHRSIVIANSSNIRALRGRIQIRNEQHKLLEHGLTRGRVDEGSLYKLGFHPLGYSSKELFEREDIKSVPDVAITLLVDESGSMETTTDGETRSRAAMARDMAIVIAEALKGIDGVALSVLGHTAQGSGHDEDDAMWKKLIIHHYKTPESDNVSSLAKSKAFCQNLDGYALLFAGKKMLKWYGNYQTKLLIHLSDGQPYGESYGGMAAMEHVKGVNDALGRDGVRVVGVGIDNPFTDDIGTLMYGSGKFVNTSGSGAYVAVANLITNTLRKAVSSANYV